ncbi:cold-shock protein [Paenibacillus nanensis]|uniref:Cold-shock protein n=2 Tax=Paenibacillus nanensis TaxID=393251 RepID=A0A3A1UP75_9BACL|nr:cold-shock protein [Paenibacillus nanensis]
MWNRMTSYSESQLTETPVWECSKPDCPCWMRKSLTFVRQPKCPACGSEMTENKRMLPKLQNNPK